jgi:queuine tRNA-ribosyltransferase
MKTPEFPIFLPDATHGAVRSVSSSDLIEAKVEGVVVNTYHLADNEQRAKLDRTGGIKNMMDFQGFVASDSGGWQLFSLIHRRGKKEHITDEGVVFDSDEGKKVIFTPEKSVQTQFSIRPDMMICLDDFTPPEADSKRVRESVERTILWAKKSKEEYLRILDEQGIDERKKPLLLAVIQGGTDKELRKYCAQALIDIGFDAYGFGGYVVDENKGLDMEISEYVAELIPDDTIKFALGTGKPYDIVRLSDMGWDIFDCTLPTRDARHQRLYTFGNKPAGHKDLINPDIFQFLYIGKQIFKEDNRPIDELCDCYTCTNHTRAQLHNYFKTKDSMALRLATIHNLRHYTKLIEYLREYKHGSN